MMHSIKAKHILIFLSIIILVELILIGFGITRSFDVGDEGYFVLGYQKGQELGVSMMTSHIFVGKLGCILNLDILNLRILRLINIILSSGILSIGVFYYTKKKIKFSLVFLVAIFGGLFSTCTSIGGIAYNDINILSLSIVSTCILLYISFENNPKKHWLFLVMGIVIPFLILNKLNTGIISCAAVFVFLLFKIKAVIKNLIPLLLGIFLSFVIIQWLFFDIPTTVKNILQSLQLYQADSSQHDLKSLISFLVNDLKTLIITFILAFIISSSFVPITQSKVLKIFIYVLAAVSILYIIKVYLIFDFYRYTFNARFLLLFLFIIFFYIWNKKIITKENALLYIVLFLLPFIFSLGSNSSLFYKLTPFIFPWFILLFVFVYQLNTKGFFLVFGATLLIFLFIFIERSIYRPFNSEPITKQHFHLKTEHDRNMYFDLKSYAFIMKMQDALLKNGFEKNDYILSPNYICGIVYLLDGRMPKHVLFSEDFVSHFFYNWPKGKRLNKNLFVIIKEDYKEPFFLENMKARGYELTSERVIGSGHYKGSNFLLYKFPL